MPAVVKGRKARAKLFDTLHQTGSHFIAVGSGSESESESDRRSNSSSRSNLPTAEESGQLVLGRASVTTDEGGGESTRGTLDVETDGHMSVRYSRVTTGDGSTSPATKAEHSKRRRSQLAEKISTKLHALFWVLAGAGVVYHTDFVRVLMEDDRVNRFWFNIAVVTFGINVVIMGYLAIWLPHVQRVRVSWNVYSPRAIPTATAMGLICAITLNASLWDVWGFLTPLILFAVFVGCLFSLHFVPWPC